MSHLPQNFKIESDRIILNILQESDATDVYKAVKYSLADLSQFTMGNI